MDYKLVGKQYIALTEDEHNIIPNMANGSALLWQSMKGINWAGFYLMDQGGLMLGPFQGKPACIRIEVGRGVCGSAVSEDRTQVIGNVHQFPGHIACDCDSNSEIVVPIHKGGRVIGVLDIDSPQLNRFSEEDREGLEQFAAILEASLIE